MLRLYTKCKYIASFRTISPEMDPLRLGFGWTIEDLDNTDALPDENTMRLVNSRMNVKFVSNYRTQTIFVLEAQVLKALSGGRIMSRSEIEKQTGLSRARTLSALESLLSRNAIMKQGTGHATKYERA